MVLSHYLDEVAEAGLTLSHNDSRYTLAGSWLPDQNEDNGRAGTADNVV